MSKKITVDELQRKCLNCQNLSACPFVKSNMQYKFRLMVCAKMIDSYHGCQLVPKEESKMAAVNALREIETIERINPLSKNRLTKVQSETEYWRLFKTEKN